MWPRLVSIKQTHLEPTLLSHSPSFYSIPSCHQASGCCQPSNQPTTRMCSIPPLELFSFVFPNNKYHAPLIVWHCSFGYVRHQTVSQNISTIISINLIKCFVCKSLLKSDIVVRVQHVNWLNLCECVCSNINGWLFWWWGFHSTPYFCAPPSQWHFNAATVIYVFRQWPLQFKSKLF